MTSELLDAPTKPAASELQSGSELCSSALLGSPTRILSLGAGVQSSTLALMAATGDNEHRLDAAIFADTQAEPADVYRWLDWLESEIAKCAYPFPVLRVTKGSLTEASLRVRTSKQTGLNYLKHSIPAYMKRANGAGGIMGRACTLDYKIIPVQQAAKKIAKVKRGQKTATAEIWIGISRDEAHRMKPSREPWAVHVWPLIDAGMNRKDCLAWMESRGYPKPPRSSCAYCPYHSDKEWLRLKSDEPEAFAAAVAYEARLQTSVSQICRLDGVPYLHSSRVPLTSVDFNPTSTEPSLFGNECEGMCGV
jgi:hypothetical protein